MSSPAHSWRSVWPLWAFRLSSSMRRLGSASALNTSSISSSPKAAIWLPFNLGSRTAACQGARRTRRAPPPATDGSVHEPVHALPWRSPDTSYRTSPAPGRSARARTRWHKAPEESRTVLTAEPLDLDYENEIIGRVHQERDQAAAVRAEMQGAQRHRDVITLVAAALVLHRIHDHGRVHECR